MPPTASAPMVRINDHDQRQKTPTANGVGQAGAARLRIDQACHEQGATTANTPASGTRARWTREVVGGGVTSDASGA